MKHYSLFHLGCQIWFWFSAPGPHVLKLIHRNPWSIIKGLPQYSKLGLRCHGWKGRNLLGATREPNWILGVSVYECVSTSSVRGNTMFWQAGVTAAAWVRNRGSWAAMLFQHWMVKNSFPGSSSSINKNMLLCKLFLVTYLLGLPTNLRRGHTQIWPSQLLGMKEREGGKEGGMAVAANPKWAGHLHCFPPLLLLPRSRSESTLLDLTLPGCCLHWKGKCSSPNVSSCLWDKDESNLT